MKLGVLGGTFDPVHLGHLLGARDALEQLGFERVIFMPAPQAPLRAPSATPAAHRLAMLRLAVRSDPAFAVSTLELDRPGPSYTCDTVAELRATHPGARLCWIIGADQLQRLPRWHRAAELAALCEFAVLARPGHAVTPPPELPGLRLLPVAPRPLAISSTEIRDRLRRGLPVRHMVPDDVLQYAAAHALYQADA